MLVTTSSLIGYASMLNKCETAIECARRTAPVETWTDLQRPNPAIRTPRVLTSDHDPHPLPLRRRRKWRWRVGKRLVESAGVERTLSECQVLAAR